MADATGLTARTVRFYEGAGLLPPPVRTLSGYRMYGDKDVQRLEFVGKAKRLGLSLVEIRNILHLHDRQEPTCLHVRSLLDEKVAQVDELLKGLREFRGELVRLRNRAGAMMDCRPTGGRICGIIEGSDFAPRPVTVPWVRAGQ